MKVKIHVVMMLVTVIVAVMLCSCGMSDGEPTIMQVSPAFVMDQDVNTQEENPAEQQDEELDAFMVNDGALTLYLPGDFVPVLLEGSDFNYFRDYVYVTGLCADYEYFNEGGMDIPATKSDFLEYLVDAVPEIGVFSEDEYGNTSSSYTLKTDSGDIYEYTIAVQGEECYWMIVFACYEDMREEYEEIFPYWGSLIKVGTEDCEKKTKEDISSMHTEDTVLLTSETGLYTVEIPWEYFVFSDDMEGEYFLERGYDEQFAEIYKYALEVMSERVDYADFWILDNELYGNLIINVASERYLKQDMLYDREVDLCDASLMVLELQGVNKEAVDYIGVRELEGNQNKFFCAEYTADDARVCQYQVVHDEEEQLISFTFYDVVEEDILSIMRSVVLR